jgi:hypothetical protein
LTVPCKWHGQQVVESKDGRGGLEFHTRRARFPKAFAGNGRLPACLADISIPIALEPKKPGRRFRYQPAFAQTRDLRSALYQWSKGKLDFLGDIVPYEENQFPPQLSSRQQDCAEPLLHIADVIGGQWPHRARKALVNVFALAAFEDFNSSRQILSDLRDAFAAKGNPEWISTADLLPYLHTLDDRAWDEWNKGKPMKPQDLAGLLEPFAIRPLNHRTGPDTVIKGYNREDFKQSWESHLPPRSDVAAHLQSPSTGISGQKLVARSSQLMSSGVADHAQDTSNGHLRPETGSLPQPATRSGVAAESTDVAAESTDKEIVDPISNPVPPKRAVYGTEAIMDYLTWTS